MYASEDQNPATPLHLNLFGLAQARISEIIGTTLINIRRSMINVDLDKCPSVHQCDFSGQTI